MKRITGSVKWFNAQKGYGFLVCDEDGKEIFVHFSAISGDGYKTLKEGDKVEFEAADSDKGLQAHDVIVIE